MAHALTASNWTEGKEQGETWDAKDEIFFMIGRLQISNFPNRKETPTKTRRYGKYSILSKNIFMKTTVDYEV